MKSKYQGLFTFILTVVVLAAVGGYYYSDIWRLPPAEPEFTGARDVDVTVPSDEQVQTMQRLMTRMPELAVPTTKSADDVAMVLFGQKPVYAGSNPRLETGDKEDGYILSLTLLAGLKRFCVINGSLFAEGATVPGGALVARIEPKRVQLIRQQKTIWVPLMEASSGTVSSVQPNGKGQS